MTNNQPCEIFYDLFQNSNINFGDDDYSFDFDSLNSLPINSNDWDFVDQEFSSIDPKLFDEFSDFILDKPNQISTDHQNDIVESRPLNNSSSHTESIFNQIIFGSNELEPHSNHYDEQRIENIYHLLKTNVTSIIDHRPNPQSVINAIFAKETPTMFWICPPPANHRFRYLTDGIRYLEASRLNPPTIELPNLSDIQLATDQSFAVQLTLVTTEENPGRKSYLHEHELSYNDDNVIQINSSSVRILLNDQDIESRKKQFRKIRIIKKKHRSYKYQLIPHDPLGSEYEPEIYVQPTGKRMTPAKRAKIFDKLYHTDQCRIICQLMFKDGENWFTTELFCRTGVISSVGSTDD